MPTYRNASVEARIWPNLRRSDGRTLELTPGERVTLDLPEDFEDEHLVLVKIAKETQSPIGAKSTEENKS